MIKFYDTCSLLDLQDKLFQSEEKFYISTITLKELEQIKTSVTKDEEIKWSARKLLRLLNNNRDKYHVSRYSTIIGDPIIKEFGLLPNNDGQIIAQVYNLQKTFPDLEFFTGDLSCKENAEGIGILSHYTEECEEEKYTGYKYIEMNNDELANFYNIILSTNQNPYNLLTNEYLLIKFEGKVIF